MDIQSLYSFEERCIGVDCPTCGRWEKINRKKLNRTMLQYLLLLYDRRNTEDWTQASRLRIKAESKKRNGELVQTGDYAILTKWSLVEEHPSVKGMVRISRLGIDFVEGKATVAQAAYIRNYNNELVKFDGPQVTFEEANSTSFVAAEL